LPHFQQAAQKKPDDADVQTNLGVLLAMRGEVSAAIQAFETALKIDPHNEAARGYLKRAQAMLGKL